VLRRLGRPDGDDGVQDTRSNAVDQARADHPGGVLRGALQAGAENGPQGAQEDGLDAADAVACCSAEEAAYERPAVIDSYNT
jgi:hypothetical protein